ncbi:MAG: hypothetical protein JKP98_19220 [Rhodobacteraceae bacterium]|nr:hypothetical protein [Paracoccaceae bacterium]
MTNFAMLASSTMDPLDPAYIIPMAFWADRIPLRARQRATGFGCSGRQ